MEDAVSEEEQDYKTPFEQELAAGKYVQAGSVACPNCDDQGEQSATLYRPRRGGEAVTYCPRCRYDDYQ